MTAKPMEPIHPGEILEHEFMLPLGLSANELARRIEVPVTRISEIVRGRRGITADTALRLSRFFGTSRDLWLGLQTEYDLRVATRELPASALNRIIPMKKSKSVYGHFDSRTASEIGEGIEPYGGGVARRSYRDRRRKRLKSSN